MKERVASTPRSLPLTPGCGSAPLGDLFRCDVSLGNGSRKSSHSSKRDAFKETLTQLDAAHDREVAGLQHKVSDLQEQVWKLREDNARLAESLKEAWMMNGDPLYHQIDNVHFQDVVQIDDVHFQDVVRDVAAELASLAASGDAGRDFQGNDCSTLAVSSQKKPIRPLSNFCGHLSSNLSEASKYGIPEEVESIDEVVQRWLLLVDHTLFAAMSKPIYNLREAWVQHETYVSKVILKHNSNSLDLRVLEPMGHIRSSRHVSRRASPLVLPAFHSWAWAIKAMDPQCPQRVAWMAVSMVLVLYDLVLTPLQVFQVEDDPRIDMAFQVFWTLDIIVNFFTGVYKDNDLCLNLRVIALEYLRTWLFLDLLVVMPLWPYTLYSITRTGWFHSEPFLSIINVLPILKFFKVFRIVKFEHYRQELVMRTNSSMVLFAAGIVKDLMFFLLTLHVLACVWYLIGSISENGWLKELEDHEGPYLYVSSLHWAITQFQGTSEIVVAQGNMLERTYAVITVIVALLMLANLVSGLTNNMIQRQKESEERTYLQLQVRTFLGSNKISGGLSVRVKKFIDWKQRTNHSKHGDGVLELLPETMQADILHEVRAPRVTIHDFFGAFRSRHPRTFRTLCFEALKGFQPAPEEWIFKPHDEGHLMYFITHGECLYSCARGTYRFLGETGTDTLMKQLEETLRSFSDRLKQDKNSTTVPEENDIKLVALKPGAWLCEAALWTVWDHIGGLICTKDATLLTLSDDAFSMVVRRHPPAHVSAVIYARQFVAELNRFGKNYSDHIDLEDFRAWRKHRQTR